MINQIHFGDCIETMKGWPDQLVQTCVTSPPYFGLRDYGHAGQIGLEATPDAYVAKMIEVFREVRRVLRDDGTLWLNLGDSYASATKGSGGAGKSTLGPNRDLQNIDFQKMEARKFSCGLADKQLIGIPWRVAFALQADGWYLRQDIIWSKPNPMPESVRDRCTKAHEYIFMFAKAERYYYDAAAIRNPPSEALLKQVMEGYEGEATKDYAGGGAQDPSATKSRIIDGARARVDKQRGHSRRHDGFNDRWDGMSREEQMAMGSNKRSVWTVPTKPYAGAHFATFPPDLIEPCILAGAPAGGIVLDPFMGSGTTAQVAQDLGRQYIGCELNQDYEPLQKERTSQQGLAL